MTRRPQPTNPAQAMAARLRRLEAAAEAVRADDPRPERWGVATDALALPRHAEVVAERDGAGRIAHAHRTDVFERLHERGSLGAPQLAAVRRLQRDMARRQGSYGAPMDLVKVDTTARPGGATERMLAAGERVERALAASGPRSAELLRALLEPAVLTGEAARWRDTVRRVAGEENPHAQAAAVRAACDNLQLAYQAADRGRAA